jgi:hypothetical protein
MMILSTALVVLLQVVTLPQEPAPRAAKPAGAQGQALPQVILDGLRAYKDADPEPAI